MRLSWQLCTIEGVWRKISAVYARFPLKKKIIGLRIFGRGLLLLSTVYTCMYVYLVKVDVHEWQ